MEVQAKSVRMYGLNAIAHSCMTYIHRSKRQTEALKSQGEPRDSINRLKKQLGFPSSQLTEKAKNANMDPRLPLHVMKNILGVTNQKPHQNAKFRMPSLQKPRPPTRRSIQLLAGSSTCRSKIKTWVQASKLIWKA